MAAVRPPSQRWSFVAPYQTSAWHPRQTGNAVIALQMTIRASDHEMNPLQTTPSMMLNQAFPASKSIGFFIVGIAFVLVDLARRFRRSRERDSAGNEQCDRSECDRRENAKRTHLHPPDRPPQASHTLLPLQAGRIPM